MCVAYMKLVSRGELHPEGLCSLVSSGGQRLDADSGLGIDPWARSSQAAKESVFNGVNRLLMPEEKSQLLELCGRCLYHPISTAVALRVSALLPCLLLSPYFLSLSHC
jgi:hypothetical protein